MNHARRLHRLVPVLTVLVVGGCRGIFGIEPAELIEPVVGTGGATSSSTASGTGGGPASTCTDSARDGAETDVDCGGAVCDAQGKTCGFGRGCRVSADCASGYCNCPSSQPCDGGTCDAFTIAAGQSSAYGIAVRETSVFWTDVGNGNVMKGAVGGGPPFVLVSGQSSPKAIAVNATNVLWTSLDGLMMVPIDGVPDDGGAPKVISLNLTGGVTVPGNNIFWTNAELGQVQERPVAAGPPPPPLATGQDSPSGIAVDGMSVYWTTADSVRKVPLGGGSVSTLASGQSNPGAIVVDATHVYWTTVSGILSTPIVGGGSLVTVASGAPIGLAVDATHVYWTDASGGTVMKAAVKGGGLPTVLASGQPTPTGIAVDGTSVYWTAGPYVRKVLK